MKTSAISASLAACFAILIASATPADDKIEGLAVYPPEISLTTKSDLQRFIVVATRDDGVTLDVTDKATIKLAEPKFCRVEKNVLYPAADGQTKLEIAYAGLNAAATVTVKDAAAERPVSFQLDVMPVFMRGGCNTGSCHGAARGKDGFRLSLFGFDPQGDYYRLTRELGTRRINLASPADSLLIEKTIGAVPHTGGKRFELDSEYCQTLLKWLDGGALNDAKPTPAVVGVDLYPPSAVLEGENATQQFIARARYADGTDRDITSLATFLTNNETAAPITTDGLVKNAARGEALIMARFETHTVGNQVLTLPKGLKYSPPQIVGNYIDELVGEKLKKLRLLPSPRCTDEEFLRRATIDITGTLPTGEEYGAFLADEGSDKRARLIDQLLERKEFGEIWAMKWAELLMIKTTNQISPKTAYLYSTWLADRITGGVPLDKIVQELLSASGGTLHNPPAAYFHIERNTLKTAENVAQVFCGIRTQCAQCHNHPFDRWTMDDYYSFAAFFAQVGRKPGEDPRETIVFNSGGGSVNHPLKGAVKDPKFLGEATTRPIPPGRDRREVVATWLASPENPYFAKNLANIVWNHFFGRGIINPVDDVRISNPASNPELLEALGEHFQSYKYDFKRLVRDICTSRTYQLATTTNDTNELDEKNFSHASIRRIRAEVLLDVINQTTESKQKFRGLPLGSRAVQIADGRTTDYFLTTFGRATRETVCSCEVSMEPNLSQALHLLNGNTVQGKVANGGVVAKLLAEKKSPQEVVSDLYLRTLTRRPTAREVERFDKILADLKPDEQRKVLEDLFWALLNSEEFIFNH
jgi:hypothetical protein